MRITVNSASGRAGTGDSRYVLSKYGQPRTSGLYRLRDTFFALFIVMDHKSWRTQGVLLACKDEKSAIAHGMIGAAGNGSSQERLDLGAANQAWVFRFTLKQAMQIVVCKSENRRRKRKEYNAAFDDTYGSGDET